MNDSGTWEYRGHPLRKLEWGLWSATDEDERYLLCYRPRGRAGPVIRRWAHVDGQHLTLDDLRDHVRRVRARINARKMGLPDRVSAAASVADYLRDLRRPVCVRRTGRRNRSPKHVVGLERSLTALLDEAEPGTVDELTPADIADLLTDLHARGRSPRTLNKYLSHVHSWLGLPVRVRTQTGWAVRRGQIDRNPADAVERATVDRTIQDPPRPMEFLQLVRGCSAYDAGVFSILAFTGLRRGSFLSLSGTCFRLDGILVPRTKRRREWFLSYGAGCPLWGPDLGRLGRLLWERRPPTPACALHADRPDQLRFHWEAARQKVGEPWRLHDLRHAFCSWLVMLGESLADVAAWAHHASQVTTERYTHFRPYGRARADSVRRRVFTSRSRYLRRALDGLS